MFNMDIRDKYRVYFLPQSSTHSSSDDVEGRSYSMGEGEEDRLDGLDEYGIERVDENRKMINDNANRIVRIDERTAFMARILFGMLIAMIASVGVAIFISLLPY